MRPRSRDAVSGFDVQIGCKTFRHVFGADLVDGQGPEWPGIFPQRHLPLRFVLGVPPLRRHGGDEVVCDAAERWRRAILSAGVNGIDPGCHSGAGFSREFAGASQGHRLQATKPHLFELAIPPEEEGPALRATRVDDEIEPASIGVSALLRERGDGPCAQAVHLVGHSAEPPTITLTVNVDRSASARTRTDELSGFVLENQWTDWTSSDGLGLGNGGRGGIRTLDTVSRIHTFQACALNHSATLPSADAYGEARGFCKCAMRDPASPAPANVYAAAAAA